MATNAPAAAQRAASSGPVSAAVVGGKSSGSPTLRICQISPNSVFGACTSAPRIVVNALVRNGRVSVIGKPYFGRKWSVSARKSYPASRYSVHTCSGSRTASDAVEWVCKFPLKKRPSAANGASKGIGHLRRIIGFYDSLGNLHHPCK